MSALKSVPKYEVTPVTSIEIPELKTNASGAASSSTKNSSIKKIAKNFAGFFAKGIFTEKPDKSSPLAHENHFYQISSTNLKQKLLENEQLIHKLFNEIENHLKVQADLVNQNLELKMNINSLKEEIKGISHMWQSTSQENQFLRDKNKKLLEYSTSLAHSLRRSLNLNSISHEINSSEKEIISEMIMNNITNNESAQKLVDYEINEAFNDRM